MPDGPGSILARPSLSAVPGLLVWREYQTECLVPRIWPKSMSDLRVLLAVHVNQPQAVGNQRRAGEVSPAALGS